MYGEQLLGEGDVSQFHEEVVRLVEGYPGVEGRRLVSDGHGVLVRRNDGVGVGRKLRDEPWINQDLVRVDPLGMANVVSKDVSTEVVELGRERELGAQSRSDRR